MTHEVIVVGGGIGGLTTAALLAARGADVCLVERQSFVGGCATALAHHGYTFDLGAGVYSLWGFGELHQRVFAELGVPAPEVKAIDPSYAIRLPDATDVIVEANDDHFFATLATCFPECASDAISFYRRFTEIGERLLRAASRFPHLASLSMWDKAQLLLADPGLCLLLATDLNKSVNDYLRFTGPRFKCFIDAQLQSFFGDASEHCPAAYAALVLMIYRRSAYAVQGGGARLAESLAASIQASGGQIRFDSTALRLTYRGSGEVNGVTLLSGETLSASRAVVSNLTVWDTYGKLVGLNRVSDDVRKLLKNLTGWSRYLIHAGLKETAAATLPADHIIGVTEWPKGASFSVDQAFFNFTMAPLGCAGSGGRRRDGMTLAEADRWFSFRRDEIPTKSKTNHPGCLWDRLHQALPEVTESLELIEIHAARLERTRRRLGITGARACSPPTNNTRCSRIAPSCRTFTWSATQFSRGRERRPSHTRRLSSPMKSPRHLVREMAGRMHFEI
ncbi:MAG: FAD-dependent oxidoreductase [Pyrinomonadaceae bacterium]